MLEAIPLKCLSQGHKKQTCWLIFLHTILF